MKFPFGRDAGKPALEDTCHPDCPIDDVVSVRVLGLAHLLCFSKEAQLFTAQVLDQISLPPERRCPFALLSTEITETLTGKLVWSFDHCGRQSSGPDHGGCAL